MVEKFIKNIGDFYDKVKDTVGARPNIKFLVKEYDFFDKSDTPIDLCGSKDDLELSYVYSHKYTDIYEKEIRYKRYFFKRYELLNIINEHFSDQSFEPDMLSHLCKDIVVSTAVSKWVDYSSYSEFKNFKNFLLDFFEIRRNIRKPIPAKTRIPTGNSQNFEFKIKLEMTEEMIKGLIEKDLNLYGEIKEFNEIIYDTGNLFNYLKNTQF